MILYAVSYGGIDDYGILAIFSTLEKAQAFIKLREVNDPYGGCAIEYYILDEAENVRTPWLVLMDKGGSVIEAERARVYEGDRLERSYGGGDRCMHVTAWAVTMHEAVTAAKEILAWTIAEGMWENPKYQSLHVSAGAYA